MSSLRGFLAGWGLTGFVWASRARLARSDVGTRRRQNHRGIPRAGAATTRLRLILETLENKEPMRHPLFADLPPQPTVVCPECGTPVPLTEALAAPLLEAARAEYEGKLRTQNEAFAGRQEELARQRRHVCWEAAEQIGSARQTLSVNPKAPAPNRCTAGATLRLRSPDKPRLL